MTLKDLYRIEQDLNNIEWYINHHVPTEKMSEQITALLSRHEMNLVKAEGGWAYPHKAYAESLAQRVLDMHIKLAVQKFTATDLPF